MHSKEDEHTISIDEMPPQGHALKPENDAEAIKRINEELDALGAKKWREDFLTDGGSDTSYAIGKEEGRKLGWADLIEALRSMGLHDAAEQVEAYRQRALDRA